LQSYATYCIGKDRAAFEHIVVSPLMGATELWDLVKLELGIRDRTWNPSPEGYTTRLITTSLYKHLHLFKIYSIC